MCNSAATVGSSYFPRKNTFENILVDCTGQHPVLQGHPTKGRWLAQVRFASISRNNSAMLLRRVRAITGSEQVQQREAKITRSPRRRAAAMHWALRGRAP